MPTREDVVTTLRRAGCVFAEEEAALLLASASDDADLEVRVTRRAAGEPLEQVLGWAEFCGRRLAVEPGVFVPRRRTEVLAREAVALAREAGRDHRPVVVDLCCGVGALAAAVADAVADVALWAADVEPAAVRCARRNLGERAVVLEGDLDAPLPASLAGRVDVLVANVPYVPSGEIDLLPAEARLHEPRVTLDGGADGLRVLARVAAAAPRWLRPGGTVLCETSERQAARALAELSAAGLDGRTAVDEDLGATVVLGTRR